MTTLTDKIRKLVSEADRAHARIDEQLGRDIHELTTSKYGATKAKPKRRATTPPAGKGETASAILVALRQHPRLKLAELAVSIGKTRSNTYNSAKRLVDRGTITKDEYGYYFLPSQNGSVPQIPAHEPREPVSLLGPEAR